MKHWSLSTFSTWQADQPSGSVTTDLVSQSVHAAAQQLMTSHVKSENTLAAIFTLMVVPVCCDQDTEQYFDTFPHVS